MPTVIRNQKDIEGASMEDLVHSYQELTGKRITGFESIEVAKTKVANAILSAQNKAGHLGVPKGTKPQTLTKKERDELAEEKGKPSPDAEPEPKAASEKPKTTRTRRAKPATVRPTGKEATTLKEGSSRARVLAYVTEHGEVSFETLEKEFGDDAKAVHKLIEKGYVEAT